MENFVKTTIFICSLLWYMMLMMSIMHISDTIYHFPGVIASLAFFALTYSITVERDEGTKIYEFMPKTYRQLLNVVATAGVIFWIMKTQPYPVELVSAFVIYSIIYMGIILHDIWKRYEYYHYH